MSVLTTHNSTITSNGSVVVKPPQPGTLYNISVTPCNMGGCNKSCEIHSERAAVVPTGGGECPWHAKLAEMIEGERLYALINDMQ